jgi:polysaccharide transporter, PST family
MGVNAIVRGMLSAVKQPERRLVAVNFAWLVADKLVRFVIGAFVGFYVARYLGPERLGSIGYATAIAGVAILLAEGGLEAIVRRNIAAKPEQESHMLAAALTWRLIVAFASYALIVVFCYAGQVSPVERGLLPVLGLIVFQPAIMLSALWFQVHMKSRITVLIQWCALLVSSIIRIIFVYIHADVVAFAWMTIFEVGVCAVLLAWRAHAEGLRFDFGRKVLLTALLLAREAWPILLSGIAVAVYMRIDTVMLKNMAGESSVGIYMAGVKFSEIWLFAPGALAGSMVPGLARARVEGGEHYALKVRQYCKISALLGYSLAIPTFILGPVLVHLAYGEMFVAAIPVQLVHAWILLFAALGVARGQVCVLEGWTRFHLAATIAGALLNIGLNWFLIPAYGPVGAALATLAAQIVAAWLSTYFFKPARTLAWTQTHALFYPFPTFQE